MVGYSLVALALSVRARKTVLTRIKRMSIFAQGWQYLGVRARRSVPAEHAVASNFYRLQTGYLCCTSTWPIYENSFSSMSVSVIWRHLLYSQRSYYDGLPESPTPWVGPERLGLSFAEPVIIASWILATQSYLPDSGRRRWSPLNV